MEMSVNINERHLARRVALSTLFCAGSPAGPSVDECKKIAVENLELSEGDWDGALAERIVEGVNKHLTELDEKIKAYAPQWPLDKIFRIDLVILRIALFEILYCEDIPDKVAIDEAIELAKSFGNDTSGKFVNGVLGTIMDQKQE